MKKILYLVPLLALLLPLAASAHQHAVFTIGKTAYTFTVGSLNEPVAVDDKTGVDLTVTKGGGMPTMGADGDMDGPAAASVLVAGLESTLQVELSAGGQKKTLALSPAYGKPGAYTAAFYPTVATSISYRFFGTIEGNQVDVTFTCSPAGATPANEGQKDLGNGIMQVSKMGAFGCPLDKTSMGFPEPSATIGALSGEASGANTWAYVALGVSVVPLLLGVFRKKS